MSQVYLVTGCSSGIGLALVNRIHELGHKVYAGVRDIKSISCLESISIIPLVLDITKESDINDCVSFIKKTEGKLDVLINNAGYGAMGPLIEMPIQAIKAQFDTNTFSQLSLIQNTLPLLKQSSNPKIINIGSSAGLLKVPFSGAYCASKAAFHAFSDILRMELSPMNIQVVTVYPGGVSSNFGDNATVKFSETLVNNSLYLPIAPAIENRANISKTSPTTPEIFAHKLLQLISKNKPPSTIRIGRGSTLMALIERWMPLIVQEYILKKSYQLNKLNIQ